VRSGLEGGRELPSGSSRSFRRAVRSRPGPGVARSLGSRFAQLRVGKSSSDREVRVGSGPEVWVVVLWRGRTPREYRPVVAEKSAAVVNGLAGGVRLRSRRSSRNETVLRFGVQGDREVSLRARGKRSHSPCWEPCFCAQAWWSVKSGVIRDRTVRHGTWVENGRGASGVERRPRFL